jgi:hypothetical protein
MLVGLQAVDHRGNPALRADDECSALNPHIFFAIHALFLQHAVFDGDGLVFIGQKRVGEIVFLLEFLLGGGLIGRNAEYGSAGFLDLRKCVAEPARL